MEQIWHRRVLVCQLKTGAERPPTNEERESIAFEIISSPTNKDAVLAKTQSLSCGGNCDKNQDSTVRQVRQEIAPLLTDLGLVYCDSSFDSFGNGKWSRA